VSLQFADTIIGNICTHNWFDVQGYYDGPQVDLRKCG